MNPKVRYLLACRQGVSVKEHQDRITGKAHPETLRMINVFVPSCL